LTTQDEQPGRRSDRVPTRDRLLAAARRCFLEHGYAGASTRMIAAEAGLTERTLFNLFATKAVLLQEAVADAIAELPDPGRVRDRSDAHELAQHSDLHTFLQAMATVISGVHRRSAALAAVTRQAAAVDRGAAELWAWGKRQQELDLRAFLATPVQRGWLSRTRLEEAIDGVVVLTSHETYSQLCVERGWTQVRYESWLVRHLRGDLLPDT
jgi:AcrR family transcriptional regulator